MKNYLVALILFSVVVGFAQKKPFPQSVVYEFGVKASQASFSSKDAKNIYEDWIAIYFEDLKKNRARIKWDGGGNWKGIDGADQDYTASEGIGYGMILTSYHGDKAKFDKLLNFYNWTIDTKASLIGGSRTDHLMPWMVNAQGQPCDGKNGCQKEGGVGGMGGATDGDIDAAMALIVAYEQWETPSYLERAREIIWLLKKSYLDRCPEADNRWVIRPGDFAGCGSEVPQIDKVHDLSYYMPGYFRVFANVTGDLDWNEIANDSYYHLAKTPGILPPDWQRPNGSKPTGKSAFRTYDYSYDASRIPWRLALDYSWYGVSASKEWLKSTVNWVHTTLGGPEKIISVYSKEGVALNKNHEPSAAFTGGFAVGSMASTQKDVDAFAETLKNLYYQKCPEGIGQPCTMGYFHLTLAAMYALNLTGNFWRPDSSKIYSSAYTRLGSLSVIHNQKNNSLALQGKITEASNFIMKNIHGKTITTFDVTPAEKLPFNFKLDTVKTGLSFMIGKQGEEQIVKKVLIP